MTNDLGKTNAMRAASAMPMLPLVSVIVISYNFAAYLEAAVASVLDQTYANVECIVVDDVSADESGAVLDALDRRDPRITIIRRETNGGQTQASLDGLAVARGAYVIFVDGDDMLLPTCIEAHVYTHLSLRAHVGMTSGDMLQATDGQIVVTTGEEFNRYIRSGKGLKGDWVRPFLGAPDDETRFAKTAQRLDGRIHRVPPLATRWVWSPNSGNCYRRDALVMFADNPHLARLKTSTEMYFAHAISALSGSALIDEPVFVYRIHGANNFSQRAQLDRTLPFRPGSAGDSNDYARLCIIDHLVAQAARFAPNIWLKLNLVALMIRLDRSDPDPTLPGWQRHSRLARRLAENRVEVERVLGRWLTLFLRAYCGAIGR